MATIGDPFILHEARSEPLDSFTGAHVLVEASYYLQRVIDEYPVKEPLLCALGGLPLALQEFIQTDLERWQSRQINPVFIFDGQSVVGKEDLSLATSTAAARKSDLAWVSYSSHNADKAVTEFRDSGFIKADRYSVFLQRILVSKGIAFQVAPHNACAQIAYLDAEGIANDAIYASKEILLYPLSDACLITNINFERDVAYGLIRSDLIRKLGVSEETFIDSLLMTGTSFLPTFPVLKDQSITTEQAYSVQTAIGMYRGAGHSIQALCNTFDKDIERLDSEWKTKFLKAKMILRHPIALHKGGEIVVANYDSLTQDNFEYLGLSIPQELYHYMCAGTLRLRIISQLSSLMSFVFPPLAGGDSTEYKRLVGEQLTKIREQGLALIVGQAMNGRLARAFQFKKVEMVFYTDEIPKVMLDHMGFTPRPQDIVKTWSVRSSTWSDQNVAAKHKPGSIAFAVLSLRNKEFAKATVSKESGPSKINGQDEILANILWRFLHLRGYINDSHELTPWGEALATILEKLGSSFKQDEAAFLAVELLKYDQLNVKDRHEDWVGCAMNGSDEDKAHCLLVARCTSLLKLRHESIGYTGPLSKNLLAFNSINAAVREADRDLLETVFAAMFLYAHADRQQQHWDELGLGLPLADENSAALGIAVKTFLDDSVTPSMSIEERRQCRSNYATKFCPHATNFPEDLDTAFKFFDAVCEGVKVLSQTHGALQNAAVWQSAKAYLDLRRPPPFDASVDPATVNGTSS